MFFRNPQLLLLLLAFLPVAIFFWRWRGRRVVPAALVLRLLALTVLIFALAEPTLGREMPPPEPMVLLVDQSDSLSPASRAALRAEAETVARSLDQAALIWFGGQSVVVENPPANADQAVRQDLEAENLQRLDPSASDLAGALRLAREILSPAGGQVFLFSDGLETSGDALAEARLAAAANVQVNVWPATPVGGPEMMVTSVQAPRTLRSGEEYAVDVRVGFLPPAGTVSAAATLRLFEGETLLAEEAVTLDAGDNSFILRHQAAEPGIVRLRAEISGADDGFSRNNVGGTTALVAEPPAVLLVEGRVGSANELSAALNRSQIANDVISAANLPVRLSDLDQYDGMVLVDVPAASLSIDQMASVREFVRSEGRGLVATGGRNSYGLGAYKNTPLEDVLPVSMDPPERPQRPDIALLLIVDRSASMTAIAGVSKFDMAKEAAMLSVESLQSEDSVGILSFDTGQLWVVPFQRIGQGLSREQIQDAIAQLPAGGGTDIFNALNEGIPAIAREQTSVRHVVLLTDGRSFTNDMGAYQRLIDGARRQDITLSTIAIGDDADTELLDILAQWGGGRYYFAAVPEDIPRLTLLESEIARADPVVEEDFRAQLGSTHPLMRGFAPAELPPLAGYIATAAKPSAEVVLRSPADDPVMATWQYGLGRAIAWTSSLEQPWSAQWAGWPDYDRFWSQVVRYTLPEPDSGPLQVRVESTEAGARLSVDALEAGGQPRDLATVGARITLPDGTSRDIPVRQVAPGRYAQELALSSEGPYAISVLLLDGEERQEAMTGYVQTAPAEYRAAFNQDAGNGVALLEEIATITGGEINADVVAEGTRQPIVPPEPRPLWPWLVGAALLLWVLEIAVRRGLFLRFT
jgi:uncharacterized membrane protein